LQEIEGNLASPDYTGPFRAQGIFFADEFGQLPPTHRLITGIALRPDASVVAPRSVEWLDTVWVFSTNPRAELSSSISGNHGADAALVYQGDLFLSTAAGGPDGGPQAFDYRIEFQTPFHYDPAQGNLIWEIQAPFGYSPAMLDDQQDDGTTVQIANIDMSDEADLFFGRGLIAQFTFASTVALGDFDADGHLGFADIDALTSAIRTGVFDARFDVNNDRQLGEQDRTFWVHELKGTWFGDANLDGAVQFGDFVLLANHFGLSGGWGDGDFDGTGDTQFADFVLLAENFGRGSSVPASVPEPWASHLALIGLLGLIARRRVRSVARRSRTK
jgi:hypothetical protein